MSDVLRQSIHLGSGTTALHLVLKHSEFSLVLRLSHIIYDYLIIPENIHCKASGKELVKSHSIIHLLRVVVAAMRQTTRRPIFGTSAVTQASSLVPRPSHTRLSRLSLKLENNLNPSFDPLSYVSQPHEQSLVIISPCISW